MVLCNLVLWHAREIEYTVCVYMHVHNIIYIPNHVTHTHTHTSWADVELSGSIGTVMSYHVITHS